MHAPYEIRYHRPNCGEPIAFDCREAVRIPFKQIEDWGKRIVYAFVSTNERSGCVAVFGEEYSSPSSHLIGWSSPADE